MIFYAIQQKSTGFLMPLRRSRKGFTYDEPQPASLTVPRLFTRASHAKQALNWWLKGATGYIRGGIEDEWEITTQPKPDRSPSDMQIIRVNVRILGPATLGGEQDGSY